MTYSRYKPTPPKSVRIDDTPDAPSARRLPSIRLWPAVVILLFGALALIWNWLLRGQASQQERVLTTFGITFFVAVSLLGWAVLLSRVRLAARLAVLGLVLVAAVVARQFVEIRGVTGDLVPILAWRWTPTAEQRVSDAAAADTHGAAAEIQRLRDAGDWPQFLGSDRREPVAADVRLARDWSLQPPRVVWRQPIGPGWSGFAVAGGRAVTQEQRGEQERITCYELATGRLLWIHSYEARYATTVGGIGPRATPTIHEGRVYAYGATGILTCVDLETGALLWQRDSLADTSAKRVMEWGLASSPLVLEDLVIVGPGGRADQTLIAYHIVNGDVAWRSGPGEGRGSYSSPMLATLGGVPQVLMLNQRNVTAHVPTDGRVLWKIDWPGDHPKVVQPLIIDEQRLFISSGYGVGCALFTLGPQDEDLWTVERAFRNVAMKAKFANMVHREGHVYGLDDGILTCVEAATGKRQWKGGRYGHGQIILIGDLLLITAESGEIVLVEADPQEHIELTRFTAFDHKLWNPPALAGRYLLVRTDREAACFELPVAGRMIARP